MPKHYAVHTLSHKAQAAGTLVRPEMVQWIFVTEVRRRNQLCFKLSKAQTVLLIQMEPSAQTLLVFSLFIPEESTHLAV